jgi:hypothetical protein
MDKCLVDVDDDGWTFFVASQLLTAIRCSFVILVMTNIDDDEIVDANAQHTLHQYQQYIHTTSCTLSLSLSSLTEKCGERERKKEQKHKFLPMNDVLK